MGPFRTVRRRESAYIVALAAIDEIIENFSVLDDWDDRYRYVIELGRMLAPLREAARNETNKVQGCASQVWLDTRIEPDGADGPKRRSDHADHTPRDPPPAVHREADP